MFFYNTLHKISPEIAEIYKDVYVELVTGMNGMTLRDLMIDFGICPYQSDSLEVLSQDFKSVVLCELLNNRSFQELPIHRAYVYEVDGNTQFAYILATKKCLGCGKKHHIVLVDNGKGYGLHVFQEMPKTHRTIATPSCVYDVIGHFLKEHEYER